MKPFELLASSDHAAWDRMLRSHTSALMRHAATFKGEHSRPGKMLVKLDNWLWKVLSPQLNNMAEPFLTREQLLQVINYRITLDQNHHGTALALKSSTVEVENLSRRAFKFLKDSLPSPSDGTHPSSDFQDAVLPALNCLKSSTQNSKAASGLSSMRVSTALSILAVFDHSLPFFDDKTYIAVTSTERNTTSAKMSSAYGIKDIKYVISRFRAKAEELGWTVWKVQRALWACAVFQDIELSGIPTSFPRNDSHCQVEEHTATNAPNIDGVTDDSEVVNGDASNNGKRASNSPASEKTKKRKKS
ncbi:hypothetical protein BC829DRAFT_254010 [Chytridium lagenaria]|nr:hypothetical protein BC829DRAFT_254010 [Chytridium lagenaria]